MKIFNSKKSAENEHDTRSSLADVVLKSIHDGVIMTDKTGVINFVNPAAVQMTECGSESKATGLDYGLVIKIESKRIVWFKKLTGLQKISSFHAGAISSDTFILGCFPSYFM